MVNQHKKIITMTKLALYDKREGSADRVANDYFRHDYIYRKNLGTRLAVGLGGMILLAIYWLSEIFVEGVDVFEMNIQQHVTDSILFVVMLLALYSLIGTIQGTREYYLVQKRLEQYRNMLRFLENAEARTKPSSPEKSREAREELRESREREGATAPRPRETERERREAREARQREREAERERREARQRERDPETTRPPQRTYQPQKRPAYTPTVRPRNTTNDAPLVRKPPS